MAERSKRGLTNPANRSTGKPKRHDMAPQIRCAFIAALKRVQHRTGKDLPDVMLDWLLEDPYKMLLAMSKYNLRDSTINATVDHTVKSEPLSTTVDFIRSVIAEQDAGQNAVDVQERPVLSTALRVVKEGYAASVDPEPLPRGAREP